MGEITREQVAEATKTGDEGGEAPDTSKPLKGAKPPPADPEAEGGSTAATEPDSPPSGQDTGGTEPQGKPSAADLDAFSFPDNDDIPELLRGKKGSEAVQAYKTLFDTSKRMAEYMRQQGQQPTQQQPPQQQPPAQKAPEHLFTSDDFISGDPSVIEQKLDQFFQQKAAPLLTDIYRGMSIQTMNSAKQTLQHFKKYEQEIMQEVGHLPINQTANYATWKDAHDRVVARHIDDIVTERSNNRPAPPVTERGGGDPPAGGGDNNELTADDIKIADGLGVPRAVFARMKGVYDSKTGEI